MRPALEMATYGNGAPSAPPLAGGLDSLSSLSAASSSSPTAPASAPPAPTCHVGLYTDLLHRAGGDHGLVSTWLAEMGFKCEPGVARAASERLREQGRSPHGGSEGSESGGIKAVGAAGGALGSSWSSMAATHGSQPKTDPLRSAPAATAPAGDLDTRAAAAGAPKHFFCPISLQIMRDPVVVTTGQTYDRPCIERWLAQGNSPTCPATGLPIPAPVQLVPNVALRNSIEEWAEKHAPWLLDRHRRVKPVPREESFTNLPPASTVTDPDLALAIQLQQQELHNISNQRRTAAAGGMAAAGAAAGAAAAGAPRPLWPNPTGPPSSRAPPAGSSMRAAPSSSQSSLRQYPPPQIYSGPAPPGVAAGAVPPVRRRQCMTLSTLLLVATTAAWIALFVVALAKNGWNLGDLNFNPWAGADQAALLAVGAQEASLVTTGGQWWRLFSSPFVNAGIIQLLFNMSLLWTLGRHLEGTLAAQHPGLCLAAIYLAGSWVGALASANLNAYYVTCGASAGVASLLGAALADQMINSKRYVNHAFTCVVLLLLAAIVIVMSLLPLMDPWYQGAALLTGLVGGTVVLAAPRAARGRPRARGWLALQCLCAVLVIAGASLGAVGIATKADVGKQTSFLQDASCITFGRWQCLPVGASPNGCQVEEQGDGSDVLRCPSGVLAPLPSGTGITPGDTASLTDLCFQYCALSGGVTGGGGGDGGEPVSSPPPPPSSPPPAAGAGAGSLPPGNGSTGCTNATVNPGGDGVQC